MGSERAFRQITAQGNELLRRYSSFPPAQAV
jgi:hypothetical protein